MRKWKSLLYYNFSSTGNGYNIAIIKSENCVISMLTAVFSSHNLLHAIVKGDRYSVKSVLLNT